MNAAILRGASALAIAFVAMLVLGSSPAQAAAKHATLTEVIDGDTVEVQLDGGPERSVRLIGIDTPEVALFGNPAECGAAEASTALDRFEGIRVRLRRDLTQDGRDRFGRLLRYVLTAKRSKDIGRSQIARGLAAVFVYEDPFTRLASYEWAAAQARAAGLGGWSVCDGDFHRPLD